MNKNYRADVQWKGTNICMDFVCPCGQDSHFDGFTFGYVKCFKCGQNFELDYRIAITQIDENKTHGGGMIDIEEQERIRGDNK